MRFEFATAGRILAGPGRAADLPAVANSNLTVPSSPTAGDGQASGTVTGW